MDVKNKTLTSVLLALKRFGRSKWTRRIGLGLLLFSLLMGVLFWSLLFNPFESDYEGPLAELAHGPTLPARPASWGAPVALL